MSLVSKYGTPISRTADTLERTIEAAIEFLAQKNRDERDIAFKEKEYDFAVSSKILDGIQRQFGNKIIIPPEAYTDSAALAQVQQKAAKLNTLKTRAEKIAPLGSYPTQGSLSDLATDVLSHGGVEIYADDGSVSMLDMDVTPFAMTGSDITVVEQWILGNSALTGAAFLSEDQMTDEYIAEFERLGLFDPGEFTVDNWRPADSDAQTNTPGDQLRERWADYSDFIKSNSEYVTSEAYAGIISDNLKLEKDYMEKVRGTPSYIRVATATSQFDNIKTSLSMNDDGQYVIGANEYDSLSELGEDHPVLANVLHIPIEALSRDWKKIDKALKKEATANGYMSLYGVMLKTVGDYRTMLSMEAADEFGTSNARHQGELAVGVMDRVYDLQTVLDPIILNIIHDESITTLADAETAFKQALKDSGIYRKFGYTGETVDGQPQLDPIFGIENPETETNMLEDVLLTYLQQLQLDFEGR